MNGFVKRYADQVKGVVAGWDRLLFRGTIRWLSSLRGMRTYMSARDMLLKDFGGWAQGLSGRIRRDCDRHAETLGVASQYLNSSSIRKDELARTIAEQRGIESGPICRLSVVEPCHAPTVVGNRREKTLELVYRPRRCVWEYFYFNDPIVGFGHIRMQTWLPFTIKGCLNGRHWLERDLMREGIGYVKSGNCFRAIDDPGRAQELFDNQLECNWARLWDEKLATYFPVMGDLFGQEKMDYYWSIEESEWATDLMFRDTATLDRLFPMLVRYGLIVSDSTDVMRYLGKISAEAALPARWTQSLRGDRKKRYEGMRVKHSYEGNSVKSYNKDGNVLRVETTVNNTRSFKVFRPDVAQGKGGWVPMRKGTADVHRRAEISNASNERYLQMLSECESADTLEETIADVCRRRRYKGRMVRALNPWEGQDAKLFEFLAQGQWTINGLRNRDLAQHLDPRAGDLDDTQRRRLTSRVSRLLRLLRAHGLIRKVPKTHRYMPTPKGCRTAALVRLASSVQTATLMQVAA